MDDSRQWFVLLRVAAADDKTSDVTTARDDVTGIDDGDAAANGHSR